MTAGDRAAGTAQSRRLDAEVALTATVTDEIRRAMRESGVRRKELALRLRVHDSQVSRILLATKSPTLVTVARVLHALGYRLEVRAVREDGAQ